MKIKSINIEDIIYWIKVILLHSVFLFILLKPNIIDNLFIGLGKTGARILGMRVCDEMLISLQNINNLQDKIIKDGYTTEYDTYLSKLGIIMDEKPTNKPKNIDDNTELMKQILNKDFDKNKFKSKAVITSKGHLILDNYEFTR